MFGARLEVQGVLYEFQCSQERGSVFVTAGRADGKPSMSVAESIDKAKYREAYAHFEFYRLLRNAILQKPMYEGSKCKFIDLVPEFPVGKDRADMVVFVNRYDDSRPEPFLVVETKQRTHTRVGESVAKAIAKALKYAAAISPSYPYAGFYDGWSLLICRAVPPYLIAVCGTITNESQARSLLVGLEEYSYARKREQLSSLPKYPDPEFLLKRILPFLAKLFAKNPDETKNLLQNWHGHISQ